MVPNFNGENVSTISVFGAGSWGTALAIYLAKKNYRVLLWHFDPAQTARMEKVRENEFFLPGIAFPDTLTCTNDLKRAVTEANILLVVVPSQPFRSVLLEIHKYSNISQPLLWATKGVDAQSTELLDKVAREIFGSEQILGVISGPNFAGEVAKGLPWATTIACSDKNALKELCLVFKSPVMGVLPSLDLTGAEVGGVVKNVVAIAVGIADGLSLGANARASIITKGLAEMIELGLKMGAYEETIVGLAGVGDLILTCTDNQSRNRRFGLQLGEGISSADALKNIGQVVEGYNNVQQVLALAKKWQVRMPIAEQVSAICFDGKDPKTGIVELMQW